MLCQDMRTMRPFKERFRKAAGYAGVPFEVMALTRALKVAKQTVHQWMNGATPQAAGIALIATTFKVDPIWLATGKGSMIPEPPDQGLSQEERYILGSYRSAEPTAKEIFLSLVRVLGKAMVIIALATPPLLQDANAADNRWSAYYDKWRRRMILLRRMASGSHAANPA